MLGAAWSLRCRNPGVKCRGAVGRGRESVLGLTHEHGPLTAFAAASTSRGQSPEVVITVVTVSALLILGSLMSVLAVWRR